MTGTFAAIFWSSSAHAAKETIMPQESISEEQQRVLKALSLSAKAFDDDVSRRIGELVNQKNKTLIIDTLSTIERKFGLNIHVFELVAYAKRAIVKGEFEEYWKKNREFEGLV